MKLVVAVLFIIFASTLSGKPNNDYYDLLQVSRDANVKEIRKAFKTLAVKLHPDKNKDDEDAEEKFIKLVKAYDVLKDPDLRKHYDLHGDDELNAQKNNRQYHSYSYYRDQFGIYDDDPLIVTLSRNDYEVNVLDDNQAWFVNFFSPNCNHCHELAPTWRKLAAELEGVIRIAAVNCEDDYSLCYQLSIESYPSLIYYEKESHLFEGIKYRGSRTLDALKEFVLSKIYVDIKEITPGSWDSLRFNRQQWLLFLCSEDNVNCPEKETQIKLTATLEGLVAVGIVKDAVLCERITESHLLNPIVFWQIITKEDNEIESIPHKIEGSDTKEILENVLNILPNPKTIDEETFKDIRTQLRLGAETPWLICFFMGQATELDLQLKRLPTLIPNINIGLVHCGKSAALCSSLQVARYPTWGVVKVGGAFELHYGRDVLHEVAAFARDSVKSTNLHALSPADFYNLRDEGTAWFVDWYAPWCPPCRKLMPEIRKASQKFVPEKVQFGTVDCTVHRDLCSKQGITSYPTAILYNGSDLHRFQGVPNEGGIVEFVEDMINPIVFTLDDSNFIRLMRKPKEELWAVDFYAPWCGPCQRLAPEWRKVAKQIAQFDNIKIAQVDCVANADLCEAQNVKSYPTIRLYPLGSKGLNTVAIHNGNRDAVSLKRWLLSFLPSKIEPITAAEFKEQILTRKYILPWLVDFYAPWCGHCTHFEPEFRIVAERLEGTVRAVKIDCEAERIFCGGLHVHGYPTLRLYISPNEFYRIESQDSTQIIRLVKQLIQKSREQLGHDEL